MTPQKFVGSTSREVLQKVKQALGDDALIVSNRPLGHGIEVPALAASALTAAPRPRPNIANDARETEGVAANLMREMAAMKAMMQRELAGVAWSNLKHRAPARCFIFNRHYRLRIRR